MHVLLADGQTSRRAALRRLLDQDPELSVVGEVAEAEALLAQVEQTRSDLVLLDWKLPGIEITDLLATLRATHCPSKVVVFSENQQVCQKALAAGAVAFVCKDDPVEWLLATLYRVVGLSPCFAG